MEVMVDGTVSPKTQQGKFLNCFVENKIPH